MHVSKITPNTIISNLSKYLRIRRRNSIINLKKEIADKSIEWFSVFPAVRTMRNQPKNLGDIPVKFKSYPVTNFPNLGIFKIHNNVIICSNGWIKTSRNEILSESTWYATYTEDLVSKKSYQPFIFQRIKGTVLSLLSDFAARNYGHTLLDSFSRYHLFLKSGLSEKDYDFVLLPGGGNNKLTEIATRLGIPEEKIVWMRGFKYIKADCVIATSYPGLRRNYPNWVNEFFKKKLGSYHQEQNKKLYIHRAGTRKIINEKEILEIVQSYGFEIFQPEKRPDSIRDFCNASAVIGGHGAGLADIVFCRKDTPVLELIPSDHVFEYYYTLADSSQLDYGYLLCESATKKLTGTSGPSYADFYVDPEILKKAMKKHFKD